MINWSLLPNENEYRFIAVLNKKIETGRLMNALGHMTAGIASEMIPSVDMCFLDYQDKNGGIHPNISHFPFIILSADNSNKIRTIRAEAIKRNIPYGDFTSTMTIGTSQQQVKATANTSELELEYFGIVMFGKTSELKDFTGKLSLYK